MKKFFLSAIFILSSLSQYGQSITLIFTAKDSETQEYIVLDSVLVENLTLWVDTVVYGPVPVLVLPFTVGMEENIPEGTSFQLLPGGPNPFHGKTMVNVYLPARGGLRLSLADEMGKQMTAYDEVLDPGIHGFEISSCKQGFLLLGAYNGNEFQSIKLINTSSSSPGDGIKYIGTSQKALKSTYNPLDGIFLYHLGDQLQYTALASGYYSGVLQDSPSEDSIYTFYMLAFADPPSVTTAEVSDTTQTTATCGGEVISDGGTPVTSRGVCWSTSQNPTIEDSHTVDGNGLGEFISYLTGLTPSTQYYVRAYAINSAGISYGNERNFITLQEITIPGVITDTITDLTQISATSGGNVIYDGGAPVTGRGVCWSNIPNPTTDDDHTIDGSGLGVFVSFLTGLSPDTIYYVRAYATNSVGTGYGDEKSFTTPENAAACPGIPTITYEDQVYNTVVIGSQCWLKENLNIGIRINGIQEQTNNGTIEKYCYDDLESYCDEYGGLYQWNEMMEYVTMEGIQGICPEGWHLPTNAEWQILVDYLGGDEIAGGPLKESGTTHWQPPNTGATNSSGYSAFGSGFRNYDGLFYGLGLSGYFHTSTQYDATYSWIRDLTTNYAGVYSFYNEKTLGTAIRCLKDN
jgi:uncharacterized protein (TIGR02145 family)